MSMRPGAGEYSISFEISILCNLLPVKTAQHKSKIFMMKVLTIAKIYEMSLTASRKIFYAKRINYRRMK